MKWQETTLRKNTKAPMISRDMFVALTRGKYSLCVVNHGKVRNREIISSLRAESLIDKYRLIGKPSIFNDCFTYRTETSNRLVYELLSLSDCE